MGRSRSRSRSPRRRDIRRRSRSSSRDRDLDKRRRFTERRRSRSRSRTPPPPRRYRRSRSRSRSPRRRRSRTPSPRRRRRSRSGSSDKAGSSQGPGHKGDDEKPEVDESQLEGMTEEEIEMMKTMGFAQFDTTKGKYVPGVENVSSIQQNVKREQYMNRRGGFNRPLDFIA